ncbi:MAG: DNA repair protein RadA [Bacteroidota bacterium]|nr:DNA repair protein RadA [Candidatus Kapabacteria bacterium]MDW8219195.1 DNA repair protein RadA [Bacteroidota bacterium]
MKSKTIYACQHCGFTAPRWTGKCPSCGEWNTMIQEVQHTGTMRASHRLLPHNQATQRSSPVALSDIEHNDIERIHTGIAELDRVLGGGIMRGAITLVGGDPGIGKSTLMLQMCAHLSSHAPLYITGEESLQQIKSRAHRLNIDSSGLRALAETNVETIIDVIRTSSIGVAIIDSIQTLFRSTIDSVPGSVVQIRECAALLMNAAKTLNTPIFLIGHVTKDGTIAGPKVLEHIVDTVLQFEGEQIYSYRIIRATKNRYGSTNEIGVFDMSERGLREVSNPSEVFLSQRHADEPGTAVVAAMEGSRPLLVEVQALVTPTSYNVPQRSATGLDYRRLQMILAVLEKRLGVALGKHDVFVNIAGGLRLDDPAIDLGVAAAIVSSFRDIPIHADTVLIGEIGLTGEVRAVSSIEQRVNEAHKLGFTTILLPEANMKRFATPPLRTLRPANRILPALLSALRESTPTA